MVYNRFRIEVIIRCIFIGLTLFLSIFLLLNEKIISGIFLSFLAAVQIYWLILHVEKTNRDLARFINAIKFSDFSQTFNDKKSGESFKEINQAFTNIMEQFQSTRSEMEEHFQYLQTVVKHVKIGLISFSDKGEVVLINEAAKGILSINDLKNVNQLLQINPGLVETLKNIHTGQKTLVKINGNKQLSIFAAEFKMRGKLYTLVSLQDISSELERERLQNELEIARDVQLKLLPKNYPIINGYSIYAECIPANEVGGDYFDFVRVDKNKLGIVIADVAGKGLPAAFYMTLTKGIFKSYAKNIDSPKQVLIHLNDLIYRTIDRGNFITMFYAILDYENNKITFARAGHEPAILFNNKKNIFSLLRSTGLGLGLERGDLFSNTIEEGSFPLDEGDSLFFYTDGITDAINSSNIQFGFDKLQTIITSLNGAAPKEIIQKMNSEITNFRQGSPQYDDITFIALSRN